MSIIKGTNQIVAGFGGTKRSIGEVYFSQSSLATDNSGALPLFTGETIASANTVYPDFYAWVQNHPELTCTGYAYTAALAEYGECAKYVLSGGSLRLPLLKNYVKMANTTDRITQEKGGYEWGKTNYANKTDFSSGGAVPYDGILFVKAPGDVGTTDVYINEMIMYVGADSGDGFSENVCSFPVLKGDVVRYNRSTSAWLVPLSQTKNGHTTLYPWVCAYNAAVPASTAQAAQFQQALSGKADIGLANVAANLDFVVDSYDDGAGNGWYEYKSRRLVQYGFTTHSSGADARAYITFYRPMANTSYNYCVMPRGYSGGNAFSFGAGKFSVSGFSFSWDGGSADPVMVCWRVEGLKGA